MDRGIKKIFTGGGAEEHWVEFGSAACISARWRKQQRVPPLAVANALDFGRNDKGWRVEGFYAIQ